MHTTRTLAVTIAAGLLLGFPSARAQDPQEAYVRVYTPTADTKLEVQGVLTKKDGTTRMFKSPPLMMGKNYVYDMKATWTENGKTIVREKTVKVQAGMTTDVDFRLPDAAAGAAPPSPMVQVNPKVEPKPADSVPKLDVPFVPTPEKVVDKMLEMAKVKDGDVVYDLGCGDGRIVITAVGKYKAAKGVGIDIDPDRIKDSRTAAAKANVNDKATFKEGDILKMTEKDLSEATVVTLYLLPKVNEQLMPILKKLKPGTRIVSHEFKIGDWKPDEEAEVSVATDGLDHSVYLWIVK